MKKLIAVVLAIGSLSPAFSINATDETEVKNAVLNLSAKSLVGKVDDGTTVTKWPATLGPDLVFSSKSKRKPPVFVLKSPSGNPAVHFTINTSLGIPGFSKQYLSGKSFTIFVRSIPVTPTFGLSGNHLNGNGGIPRLYLCASRFCYDEITSSIDIPPATVLNKEMIFTYIYDENTASIKFLVNAKLAGEKKNIKRADNFEGNSLAVPFLAGNTAQEGYLLNLVVFDRVLNENDIKQVTEQITKD